MGTFKIIKTDNTEVNLNHDGDVSSLMKSFIDKLEIKEIHHDGTIYSDLSMAFHFSETSTLSIVEQNFKKLTPEYRKAIIHIAKNASIVGYCFVGSLVPFLLGVSTRLPNDIDIAVSSMDYEEFDNLVDSLDDPIREQSHSKVNKNINSAFLFKSKNYYNIDFFLIPEKDRLFTRHQITLHDINIPLQSLNLVILNKHEYNKHVRNDKHHNDLNEISNNFSENKINYDFDEPYRSIHEESDDDPWNAPDDLPF